MRVLVPLLLAGLILTSCATPRAGASPRERHVLTTAELEESGASTAYDVIQRQRPEWLRSRGPISVMSPEAEMPIVYVNSTRHGDVLSLRTLQLIGIAEIRFFSGPQATQRWGTGVAGGVILVTTK
jgi:hypothetical protein